jgi:hypothetical protein
MIYDAKGRGWAGWAGLGRWMVFALLISSSILGSVWMLSRPHQVAWVLSGQKDTQEKCGPRLLVIGAQKGGTTSLYKYLKKFDWIGVGRTKELHFFDKVYKRKRHIDTDNDIRQLQIEYLENFGMETVWWPGLRRNTAQSCTDYRTKVTFCCQNRGTVFADVTPRYMIIPDAPELAEQITNDPWILALIREPAARAVSHFRMEFRWDDEEIHRRNSTLFAEEFHKRVQRGIKVSRRCLTYPITEECLHRGMEHDADFVWRGVYSVHLESWFNQFGKDKLILWISENFARDPGTHLVELQDIVLGGNLSSTSVLEQDYEKFNVDEKVVEPWEGSIALLKDFYKEHNARLVKQLSSWGYHAAAQDIERLW